MVRDLHKRTLNTARTLTAPGVSLKELSARQWREIAMVVTPALALIAGAFWIASRFVEPAPPTRIAITTAGESGGYFATGKRYKAILERSGITLEVISSAGSVENVKRLLDPKSGIDVALLQGGTTNTKDAPGIVSLGRIYLEPMWVFYRGEATVDRLSQLKGRKILVGPVGSGTRMLALALLKPNGIDEGNSTLQSLAAADAIAALTAGEADAAFFTSSAEAPQVQTLLRTPGIKVMSFAQAEAYSRLFPYLTRIVLPKGAIDLVANIPSADIEMVAPVAALVARETLHPALVGLLVEAAKEVHSRGGMFNRIGEYPKALDPEFELSDDAERVYKAGPPVLQRYLPFWLATFIERMKVMALPLLTILVPLVKVVPAIFRWRVRRRIQYWYGQIRELERRVATDVNREQLDAHRAAIDRMESSVAAVPVPLAFHEQYYNLRAAIDLVRSRLA